MQGLRVEFRDEEIKDQSQNLQITKRNLVAISSNGLEILLGSFPGREFP